MKKFQVWIRGSDLFDVMAEDEKEAKQIVRDFYGWKRLPRGTFVCRIPADYYDHIVKNNQEIGINIASM